MREKIKDRIAVIFLLVIAGAISWMTYATIVTPLQPKNSDHRHESMEYVARGRINSIIVCFDSRLRVRDGKHVRIRPEKLREMAVEYINQKENHNE